ncbi:MAG: gliding motility-associated C-terminal domain-containing protein [Bacteroidota bacterium]
MNRSFTLKIISIYFFLGFILINTVKSQNPSCGPLVPYFNVNFVGNPAGVWTSPNISRVDQCCGVSTSDKCISFDVTLDPSTAGIQMDLIGADPPGALFYSINCVGSYPGGTIKCISGSGLQRITFCKSGNNKNVYKITSIAKPLFPPNDTLRAGCTKQLISYGVVDNTTNWTSIYPGTIGQYNSYLSCTNCASPNFNSVVGAPAYIDYRVCGFPQASLCGFNVQVCDTVRIYNLPGLTASITPNSATFCNLGPGSGVTLMASGTGGLAPYSYTWKNSSNVIVGTGSTYFASVAGNYTFELKDPLNSATCPSYNKTVSVTEGLLPVVSIGSQTNVFCNGGNTGSATVTAAGGSGTYSYSWNTTPVQITATANNLSAGSYTVTVTDNNGCPFPVSTFVTITEPLSALAASISSQTNVLCNGGNTGIATVVATGGSGAYSYSWNTTPVQTTATAINLSAGSYTVTATDNNGCIVPVTKVATITQPLSALGASITSQINVFCNGGNTGLATVIATGGSGAYSYSWNTTPVQTTATAINLSAGSYTVTVIDNNGCTVPVTKVATITQPSSVLGASITSQTNVFCNAGNTGSATVTATGGSGGYSYVWNTTPVQTAATATNLSAGNYTVTVTDNNGCTVPMTAVATITEPLSALASNISSQTNVFCNGGNTGLATVISTGGSGAYSYSWNTTPLQTAATATNLTAGNYTVTVTDNNGCTVPVTKVATITQPLSVLGASITSQINVFCNGGNTGLATVIATGGSGAYSYSWNTTPVQTTATAINLSAGSYTVTVIDNNGCTVPVTAIVTITQPSSVLGASITSQTNVFCNGGNTGSATVTATGGSGGYSFVWNTTPVQTTATAINLSAGSYTVTITDNNGCTVPVTAVATITEPLSALASSISSQTNVFCNGGNTGLATIVATGGSGAYSYSWNTTPVQTTATATNLTAGSYTVTVTDNNGCTVPVTKVAIITQPLSALAASITSQINVFCKGGNTGLATVIATGGSGAYSYSWNTTPVQTAATATNLTAGSYTVTITDNNGCTVPVTAVATITEPLSALASSIMSQTNVFCNGGNTGAATVTATGGSGSYSYLWNSTPVQIGATAINLSAGSYTVTVTDNNGCTIPVTSVTTVTQPVSTLSASISQQTNVFCFGCNTGSATVAATGGSGSYSYLWSTNPVQTTATANNLVAGSYTVTVTDNNGCTIPVTVIATITEPGSVLAAFISSQTNVFCFGGNTGEATVTATGGSGSYSYSWNTTPVQTTATATNLAAGSYTVTVTDNNGSTISATAIATIIQPSSGLTATISSQTNVFCNNGNTGNATVTASGGSGNYSYLWNSIPQQIGSTAVNLSAGSYTVTVADNNGCIVPVTKEVTITQPLAAIASIISSQTNVFCNGGNTGEATVTATGGSGSYSYSWNTTPVQTTATATNLSAGSYTATVTDNNGCTVPVTKVATITQPSSILSANIASQTNVFCNGGNTGSSTVTATGGSGSYSYSWNTIPVQTTATANNLSAGSYTVTVTDNNGCTTPVTAVSTITQPVSALAATINQQTNVFCNGGNTGSVTVVATGGSGSYSYLWNTSPLQIGATAVNLSAGIYTATVTDNNGCIVPVTKEVTITEPSAVIASSISSQTNVFCNGGNTGSATVIATGGSGSYSYSWNTTPVQTTATATNLTAGSYTVTVTDNNGCVIPVIVVATITQPTSALDASITAQTNVFCNGGNNGNATVTATGGSGSYSYSWNSIPAQTSAIATGLTVGSYTVTVTDNNGCTVPVTKVTTITQPSSILSASISSQTNVLCNGGNTGSVTIIATGGSGSYSYSWNTIPTQTTATASGLSAGSYTVTVTDNNGCTIPVSIVAIISQPSLALGANINQQTNVFCKDGNNGYATVSATGGSGLYSYSWNTTPAQTTATAIGLTAGSYTVTVTDNNGCVIPELVVATITQPSSALGANITAQTNVFCKGGNTGNATVTATGGSGSYSYSWNTTPAQTTATTTGLIAGSFTVTVTDNNGCTVPATKVVIITQPSSILSTGTISQTNVYCNGGSTGSASVAAIGGSGSYSYSWNTTPVQTTAYATGLTAGSYTLTVTDNNGCTIPVTTAVIITQPSSALGANISSQTNVFCNGGNTGIATVTATGGSGNYTYLWNTIPLQIGQTAINLSAGSYTVTVTDNNGCTTSAIAVAVITQPSLPLAVSLITQTNVFCKGGNTGVATIAATGGSGIYSYSWNTAPVQTSATAINLSSGSYSVLVTDNNGCLVPVTANVTITEPFSSLNASIIAQTNVLCMGDSTGNATVTATGGSGNYSYSWNTIPVQTSATATGLIAGSYSVTVKDNNGCAIPVIKIVIITEPSTGLSASITSQTNVLCYEEKTGVSIVTATGGSGSYSYLWNTVPAQIGATAINLSAGSYTVLVKDNNGCLRPVIAEFIITQPTGILSATAISPYFNTSNISCNGGSNGSINLTINGGTMPYTFSWTGPGTYSSPAENPNGLGAGVYNVNVTDKNGCLTKTTITLVEPPLMASSVGSIPADCITSNGSANLDVIGGTLPYSCLWSCGNTQQDLSGVPGGIYTVNVTDANGCLIIDTIQVDEISNLRLSSTTNNVLCYGNSDGSINLNVKGTAPFTYSWSNGATTEDLTGISAGEYFVIINDAAGCTILDTVNITQSTPIVLNLTSPVYFDNFNVSSFQGTNGAIDLSVKGGQPTYIYSWSNNATTEDLSNIVAGSYNVTVTDSLGCKISGSIVLAGPMPLEMPTGFSPNGDGRNDKFIIRGIDVYPNNHISIFNRWGNIVYQSDGYHNQWDGLNNKGDALPAATYFVIVEINNKEITLKGYVDLRRD